MAELKKGRITLKVPDEVLPPEQRGTLDPVEISHLPGTPNHLAQLCEQTAVSLEKAGDMLPELPGVTPFSLRLAAFRMRTLERLTRDAEETLAILKQMILLYQAGAYEQLRELYDTFKDQGRPSQELRSLLRPALDFFDRVINKGGDCPKPTEPTPLKTPSGK